MVEEKQKPAGCRGRARKAWSATSVDCSAHVRSAPPPRGSLASRDVASSDSSGVNLQYNELAFRKSVPRGQRFGDDAACDHIDRDGQDSG